ncbi:MAG: ADOP family duplicated permease [Gemmatimonadales bacterium]
MSHSTPWLSRAERLLRMIGLRLRSLRHRPALERELDDELRFHLDEHTALLMARGLDPQTARREALRQFGGIERRKEEVRATRGISWIEHLGRDIRYGFRALRLAPGYAAVAIITLALGVGANTAIFTVVDEILLRPLPYADPSRLVLFREEGGTAAAPANFLEWRAGTRSFDRVGAVEYWTPGLRGSEFTEKIFALHVSSDILPMMGIHPLFGRVFTPAEDHDANRHVAVLRYDFWQQRFGGDPAVLGRTVVLDGETYTIIGVMPKGFRFAPFWATEAVLWAPLPLDQRTTDRGGASLRIFARLKPGVTLAQADGDVRAVAGRLEALYPGTNQSVSLTPLSEMVTGQVRPALMILLVAVGLVLLIACANVAHLQLIRAAAREREYAVRSALGATRGRLVQQSLVESTLLSLAGGVAGLVLAEAGVKLLVALAPAELPRLGAIRLDSGVFLYLLLIAVFAAVIFGVAPALTSSRVRAESALKEGGRTPSDTPRRRRMRGALVVSEFAMALLLVVGAGLVLRSFVGLLAVDPGFDPQHTLSMVVAVDGSRSNAPGAREQFFSQLVDRVQKLPGVEAASAINHLPLHGDHWTFTYHVDGQPTPPRGKELRAQFLVARPGYFRAMHAVLQAGRDIDQADLSGHRKVVIVNDVMARHAWPRGGALGRRISIHDNPAPNDWYTVIGVVRDIRQDTWSGQAVDEMYFPNSPALAGAQGLARELDPSALTLVIRSAANPTGITRTVRAVVHDLDPDVTISDIITLEGAIGEQLAAPRFYLVLLALFAFVAVTLAAIGVYGVISYSVARRTHEIGVRLALGAAREDAFRMVLRQGMQLALLGGVIGLVLAIAMTRYLGTLLYGVRPLDLITFGAGAIALGAVALLACAAPARRAAQLDPMEALRAE